MSRARERTLSRMKSLLSAAAIASAAMPGCKPKAGDGADAASEASPPPKIEDASVVTTDASSDHGRDAAVADSLDAGAADAATDAGHDAGKPKKVQKPKPKPKPSGYEVVDMMPAPHREPRGDDGSGTST